MAEYITERLQEAAEGDRNFLRVANLLRESAEEIEKRDEILEWVRAFFFERTLVREFESGLGYEERETFREYFGLSDDDRDPFAELEDIYGEDEDDHEW